MNVCEMHEVQLDMEYQHKSEDPVLRVYMPVVRDKEMRTEQHQKVWSDRKKRTVRWALIIGFLMVEIMLSVLACVETGMLATAIATRQRGYMAIGSEVIVGPMVGIVVGFVLEKVIGAFSALDHELQ